MTAFFLIFPRFWNIYHESHGYNWFKNKSEVKFEVPFQSALVFILTGISRLLHVDKKANRHG